MVQLYTNLLSVKGAVIKAYIPEPTGKMGYKSDDDDDDNNTPKILLF